MEQTSFACKYSPKLSLDKDGFTTSFDINSFDQEKIKQFYSIHGFVIFNHVINEEEANKTIDDLWDDLTEFSKGIIKKNDPNSWNFKKMAYLKHFGFVNNKPLSKPQIWKNRQNHNVYQAFKVTYENSSGKKLTEPLLAQFDRGSLIRPTKTHPEWRGENIYHFDINPWFWTNEIAHGKENWRSEEDYEPEQFKEWLGEGNYTPNTGFTKLAGVLALSETNQQSGGFECVSGFQNHIHQWTKQHPYNTSIEEDPDLMANFQKIFQRKGSLLVFSRELPHNIYPNISENFRYAQYLRMSPESSFCLDAEQKQQRRECVKQMLPSYVSVEDAISKEIFMINTKVNQPKEGRQFCKQM